MGPKTPGSNVKNYPNDAHLLAPRVPTCPLKQAVLKALYSRKVKGSKVPSLACEFIRFRTEAQWSRLGTHSLGIVEGCCAGPLLLTASSLKQFRISDMGGLFGNRQADGAQRGKATCPRTHSFSPSYRAPLLFCFWFLFLFFLFFFFALHKMSLFLFP